MYLHTDGMKHRKEAEERQTKTYDWKITISNWGATIFGNSLIWSEGRHGGCTQG